MKNRCHSKSEFIYRAGTTDEFIIDEVYKRNTYLKSAILRFIPKGGVVVDVGAHIGCFTVLAAEQLTPKALVAIEPEPSNFDYLLRNVRAAELADIVRPIRVALSNTEGTRLLHIATQDTSVRSFVRDMTIQSPTDTPRSTNVPVTSLDILLRKLQLDNEMISVLKVDAEGAEVEILEGANAALRRTAVVVGELHEALASKEELLRHMKDFMVVFGPSFPPSKCRGFWAINRSVVSEDSSEALRERLYVASLHDLVWHWNHDFIVLQKQLFDRTEWALRLDEDVKQRDKYIGKLQTEFEERTKWALQLNSGPRSQPQRLATQREVAARALRRVLRIPLWPLVGVYRIIRPFWKLRIPPELRVQRGLVVGSTSKDTLFRVMDSLVRRFPRTQFTALVRDNVQDELRARWPHLAVEAVDRMEYRSSPWRLLIGLWRRDFELAVVVLSGEDGSHKHKSVGFLSGARHLLVYNENIDSFYWMLGQSRAAIQHLMWRKRRGLPQCNLRVLLSYPLSLLGCVIVLVRVLPVLLRGVFRHPPISGK